MERGEPDCKGGDIPPPPTPGSMSSSTPSVIVRTKLTHHGCPPPLPRPGRRRRTRAPKYTPRSSETGTGAGGGESKTAAEEPPRSGLWWRTRARLGVGDVSVARTRRRRDIGRRRTDTASENESRTKTTFGKNGRAALGFSPGPQGYFQNVRIVRRRNRSGFFRRDRVRGAVLESGTPRRGRSIDSNWKNHYGSRTVRGFRRRRLTLRRAVFDSYRRRLQTSIRRAGTSLLRERRHRFNRSNTFVIYAFRWNGGKK